VLACRKLLQRLFFNDRFSAISASTSGKLQALAGEKYREE
jgi:hypothetical protein